MKEATIKKIEELISDAKTINEDWQISRWSLRAQSFLDTAVGADEATYFEGLVSDNVFDSLALQMGRLEGLVAAADR